MYVLTDFSVYCHLLHSKYLKVAHRLSDGAIFSEWVRHQVAVYLSGHWLGNLKKSECSFIWLLDGKPYWRLSYLQSSGIEYKGGRKDAPETFLKIYSALANLLLSREYKLWRYWGYEADDLAAMFVKQSDDRSIVLATVDKDWKGLICENVSWFSLRCFKPEYRYCDSLESLNDWLASSRMPEVDSPDQLWQRLSEYGDKSDGLPKNAPIEVIDLLNPPKEHRLWERHKADWSTGKQVTERQLERSFDWLQKNGFTNDYGIPDTIIQKYGA